LGSTRLLPSYIGISDTVFGSLFLKKIKIFFQNGKIYDIVKEI